MIIPNNYVKTHFVPKKKYPSLTFCLFKPYVISRIPVDHIYTYRSGITTM